MRQLEERLGVRLLHRTTRSVSLTDAGRRLLERLRPAIDQIAGALDDLNDKQRRPYGNLRIYATHMAAAAVIVPVWRRFLSMYPEVCIELGVEEAHIDILAQVTSCAMVSRLTKPAPERPSSATSPATRTLTRRARVSAFCSRGFLKSLILHQVPGCRRDFCWI
jgi:DNA-binding transcriptional LysR family regulator